MLLVPPIHIDDRKLTGYLLIKLDSDDKSNYLGLAGYELSNWPLLRRDLLDLAKTGEAVHERSTVFGESFSITGNLTGPNGRLIVVKTIWMTETKTGLTKFVTLYPP